METATDKTIITDIDNGNQRNVTETGKAKSLSNLKPFKAGISGNPKGRPKTKLFSLREDLVNSLKRLKKSNPKQYRALIDSYWLDPKMRPFLMETLEGKATQRTEQIGSISNPIRVIEVKQLVIQAPTMPQDERNEVELTHTSSQQQIAQ